MFGPGVSGSAAGKGQREGPTVFPGEEQRCRRKRLWFFLLRLLFFLTSSHPS